MSRKSFTAYANSFQAVAKPGLKNIRALCAALGNPQEKLKFIHVAGTNGKGSVCAFLEAMCIAAGYRTGKYTSPNLVRVNERICIDGKEISDADLERILAQVADGCKAAEAQTGAQPTQFEIWTAAAFIYFAEQGCDLVVLEVGLGGELDATNIVENTLLAAICHIAIDHTEFLGSTLTSVASAKAGIIKPRCKVVSAPQASEVCAVLEEACKAKDVPLTYAKPQPLTSYNGIYECFEGTYLSLGGINQLENASVAVACARVLELDEASITAGLKNARHPARFEKINDRLYYDGAHNPDGVEMLLKNIDRYFADKSVSLVMATMADKDIAASLKLLSARISELHTVTVQDNPRAMAAEAFKSKAEALGIRATAHAALAEAITAAMQSAEITLICGSLYLYKDFDGVRGSFEA